MSTLDTERLERNLKTAARIVKNHGIKYLPIFERLEKELESANKVQASIDRVLLHCHDDR